MFAHCVGLSSLWHGKRLFFPLFRYVGLGRHFPHVVRSGGGHHRSSSVRTTLSKFPTDFFDKPPLRPLGRRGRFFSRSALLASPPCSLFASLAALFAALSSLLFRRLPLRLLLPLSSLPLLPLAFLSAPALRLWRRLLLLRLRFRNYVGLLRWRFRLFLGALSALFPLVASALALVRLRLVRRLRRRLLSQRLQRVQRLRVPVGLFLSPFFRSALAFVFGHHHANPLLPASLSGLLRPPLFAAAAGVFVPLRHAHWQRGRGLSHRR